MKAFSMIAFLLAFPAFASLAAFDVEVTKSVNNARPAAGEPVEFTVLANNIGDEQASGVSVIDVLPDGLAIPVGTAVFTSTGAYNPSTGRWYIGDLAAGEGAVMTFPAVVTDPAPAPCIVNRAASGLAVDANPANDEGRAAIYQPGVERCVDIDISFSISSRSLIFFPTCDAENHYGGYVNVTNHGPDTASNVVVTIGQSPVVGPNLRFDDADCSNPPAAHCEIGDIAPGETITIDVTSDLYRSYETFTQTLTVGATGSDFDYDLENNDPSATGVGGGFSSCEPIDLGIGDMAIGVPACFIATAAYGTSMHPHLDSLRAFRDRYLITSASGRAVVRFYYRHSPPIAAYIAKRDWLRAVVRALLAPIVFAIEFPVWAATLLLLAAVAALLARRYRYRRYTRGFRPGSA